MGVTLQAEAAQALAGILVGQVEALLQVLGGRLLHVQLLCVLLVEEANFLPERRGRWSVKVIFPLSASYSLIPKATYQPVVLPHFPTSLQGKSKGGAKGKGKGAAAPHPNFSEGELNARTGLGTSQCEKGDTGVLLNVTKAGPGNQKQEENQGGGDKKQRFRTRSRLTTSKGPSSPTPPSSKMFSGFHLRWGLRDSLWEDLEHLSEDLLSVGMRQWALSTLSWRVDKWLQPT